MAAKRKRSEPSGTHWKIAGFDAFNPDSKPNVKPPSQKRNTRRTKKAKKMKMVKCKELPEPESGIHSMAWASAIAPQSCGFLRLPVEVRNKIYEHVINDFSCGPQGAHPIKPRKKGNKFHDPEWRNASKETTALYQLCRQVYVDVYGSGLLYRFRKFEFSSPKVMLNYLWVINPVHKDSIRSIKLDLHLDHYLGCFREDPPRSCGHPFKMLSSCKNLQHLTLKILVAAKFCYFHRPLNVWVGNFDICTIQQSVLMKIQQCVALREFRGLQSFEMIFPLWHINCRSFGEKTQELLLQIEEDLRRVVTRERE